VLRSDYTVLVNLVKEFDVAKNKRSFCKSYGLSFERMNEIKESQRDLLTGLVDIGLIQSVQEGLNMDSNGKNPPSCAVYGVGLLTRSFFMFFYSQ